MKTNLDEHNQISEGYYDYVFKKSSGVQSKWHHLKFRKILEAVGDHKNVLNIACSAGTLDFLVEAENVVGIDFSLKQLIYANANNRSDCNSYVCGDACRLPIKSDSFDLVMASEFIEHINTTSFDSFLEEVYRILKPGGEVVLTTPNYLSFWPVLEIVLNKLGDVDYTEQHINKFTPSRISQMVVDKDYFKIVEIKPFLLFSPFLALGKWKLADSMFEIETPLAKKAGFLIYCHLKVNK
ncbi:class I SAM-dependent methyltransferase [Methanolobus psychrotolerans]|uniref:class I SAM-dependent methyltransferase n=1 Tax=Methanolobus psychrotolerans TaxID=1874706 RepID=UPI000B915CA4|nr:class I SAM-dependent methyltransferase [Methanolobus psychrotolerans]